VQMEENDKYRAEDRAAMQVHIVVYNEAAKGCARVVRKEGSVQWIGTRSGAGALRMHRKFATKLDICA